MIRSDEQQDRRDHYTESSNHIPSRFVIDCTVSDVVGLDYRIPVEFCEDIVEGTFEARIMVDLVIQASDLVYDITTAFQDKVKRVSYKLTHVYDNFNHEIK